MSYRLTGLCLLLLPLFLHGCADTTQVDTRYHQMTATSHSLLVAARTPEADYAASWEKACLSVLHSLDVTSASQAGVRWDGNDLGPILHWAQTHQVDHILLVDITQILIAPAMIPGYSDPSNDLYQVTPGAQNIGVPTYSIFLGKQSKRAKHPPMIRESEAQLLSPSGEMRWDAILTTHEANSINAIGKSQCKAIRKALTPAYLAK